MLLSVQRISVLACMHCTVTLYHIVFVVVIIGYILQSAFAGRGVVYYIMLKPKGCVLWVFFAYVLVAKRLNVRVTTNTPRIFTHEHRNDNFNERILSYMTCKRVYIRYYMCRNREQNLQGCRFVCSHSVAHKIRQHQDEI